MYRQHPTTCLTCGSAIEAYEADQTEGGLRCWRCTTRVEVESHHQIIRERPAALRRRRRTAMLHAGLGLMAMMVSATLLLGVIGLLRRLGW